MAASDSPDPAEDRRLVERARGGDVRAFEALLSRHEAKILRVLRYLGVRDPDREDVAQEVFLRAFRSLARFKREGDFGAWLYRIAVNAAYDHRGRLARSREVAHAEPGAAPGRANREDRASLPDDGVLREALRHALSALSARERSVFVLREVEGMSTEETAKVLGVMQVTVRRHLGRARDRLRTHLASEKKRTGRD